MTTAKKFVDTGFIPIEKAYRVFAADVSRHGGEPVAFVLERENGLKKRFDLTVLRRGVNDEKSYRYVERLVKSALWVVGGFKIYIAAPAAIVKRLQADYQKGGARAFDAEFMAKVYEKPFEVVGVPEGALPAEREQPVKIGGGLDGCRIGFDAGGSDRKVSAVIDGEVVYSEETVWFPKTNADPHYHFDGIMDSMRRAAEKMPRVDAIGVSSAGVYVANRAMAASLFIKVSEADFDKYCKDIYLRCGEAFHAPVVVANDGDVTALAGAQEFGVNAILGIAMGTSEAGGYINGEGRILGWLNELAFVPADMSPDAMADEWSGDVGCGVKYFSQDGVIKLAALQGYRFAAGLSPAEKLKEVQGLLEKDDPRAVAIFENIGHYLGHSIAWYARFYEIKNLEILGRVTSGKASDLIVNEAKAVLHAEYPEYAAVNFLFPDENNKRVGQSIAAASLPTL
jgi:predicted NBD/HSP70 family sugar kinase